ncbi:MAG: hypothetical protein ABFE08_08595 [Armatimonadia bacterium]
MTASRMLLLMSVLVVGAVYLAGCGGGGSDNGGGWGAYTPPEDVAPAETRESWAAGNVGTTAMITMAAGEDDPVNMGYMLFGLSEPIVVAIDDSIGGGGGNAVPSRSLATRSHGSPASFILRLINRAQAKGTGRSGVQTADTTDLDWTDDEYGIHWTGTLAETETSLRLNIHGVGTNTNVTVSLVMSETTASLTARGSVAQGIEWYNWDTGDWDDSSDGKGDINTTMNFSLGATSGSGTITSNFSEFLMEDGEWTEVFKGRGTCRLTIRETDDQATLGFTWNPSWGLRAGDGMYWQAFNASGEAEFDYEEGYWGDDYSLTSLTLTETSELSDGMTTRLLVAANGDISGWLKNADGEIVANFTGNYLDSTGVIDWVDSDRPNDELHIFIVY